MIILKILVTLILAILAGITFRWGGSENTHMRWARQLGIQLTELSGLWLWFGWSWWLIPISGLAWTESTYFKSKGTDAKWYNWLLCGIQYAIIPLPLVFLGTISWEGCLDRAIILVPAITLWRTFVTQVDWSEGGAGAWQLLTIPLLGLHKVFFLNI